MVRWSDGKRGGFCWYKDNPNFCFYQTFKKNNLKNQFLTFLPTLLLRKRNLYIFLIIILVFKKKSLSLRRLNELHIDYKSVASIRTLHNVKASSMLCLLVVWNLRNFKLMVKDIGGSDCYWYAHKNACRGVPWGYIVYSRHTIPESVHILAQAKTPLVHHQGQYLRASNTDE